MNAKIFSLTNNYFKTLKKWIFLNKDEALCNMIKYTHYARQVY